MRYLLALFFGALTSLSFEPFGFWPLAFVGLAGLVGDFLVGVGAVVKSILLDGVDHIVGGGAGFALERVR